MSLYGIPTGIGFVSPVIIDFFPVYAPPFLPLSLIYVVIEGIVVAAVIVVYFYNPKQTTSTGRIPPLVKLTVKLFFIAVVLWIAYIMWLRVCTTLDPRDGKQRFQIGFDRYDWSLTEKGRMLKVAYPNVSLCEFMLSGCAYSDDKIEVIWKPWTIRLGGVLTILIFMLAFILWSFACALLARQKAILELNNLDKKEKPKAKKIKKRKSK